MCEHGTHTLVETPEWWWDERTVPEKGICIDSCIAETILEAWKRGVRTAGSCCGHGKEGPSVVLPTWEHDQPAVARTVLAEIDPSRRWTIEQWQLVDVSDRTQREQS